MTGVVAHSSTRMSSYSRVESCVRCHKGGQVRPLDAWLVYHLRSRCLTAQMVAPEFILTLRIMSDSDWYPIGTVPAGEALGTSSRGTPAPYPVTQRLWFSVRRLRWRGGGRWHIVGLDQGHDPTSTIFTPQDDFRMIPSAPSQRDAGHDIGHLLWPLGTHMV